MVGRDLSAVVAFDNPRQEKEYGVRRRCVNFAYEENVEILCSIKIYDTKTLSMEVMFIQIQRGVVTIGPKRPFCPC